MHSALLVTAAIIGQFTVPDHSTGRAIVRECPELLDARNDFERVNILRCWAWAATDFVHTKSCGAVTDSPFHIGWPDCPPNLDYYPPTFYGQFRDLKGGVWVTECAIGFARLCRDFGYRAESVSLQGTFNTDMHHCQTLIEIAHRGKKVVTLHDPTFNVTFVDRRTMEPLDYFELLRRLGRREHTSIRAFGPDYTEVHRWPRVVVPDDQVHGMTPDEVQRPFWTILDDVFHCERVNGNFVYTSPRTLEKWLRVEGHDRITGEPKILARLVADGYPPDWLYLHMKLRGISALSRPVKRWGDRHPAAIALGEGERLELAGN